MVFQDIRSVWQRLKYHSYHCGLLSTFTMERKANFQLGISENKDIILFPYPNPRAQILATDAGGSLILV